MSGHLLTAGQCRPRAWLLLTLLALPSGVMAQIVGASEASPSVDPIVLSAERVSYWDEENRRWVLLDGHAAAFQGPDGLRASHAVARIDTVHKGRSIVYRVEVYAEGEVQVTERPGQSFPTLRVHHDSQSDVKFRSDGPGGIQHLPAPPGQNGLLSRGFPSRPQPPVASSPGPAQPRVSRAASVPIQAPKLDPEVQRCEFDDGFPEGPTTDPMLLEEPEQEMTPSIDQGPFDEGMSPDLGAEPYVNPDDLVPPAELAPEDTTERPEVVAPDAPPLLPNTRRLISINPRDSGANFTYEVLPVDGDSGLYKLLLRGGVRIVAEEPGKGIIDVSADNAVIWTKFGDGVGPPGLNNVTSMDTDPRQPFEVYLEGHVVFRQDRQKVAGDGDQMEVFADQHYMDLRNEWFIAEQAELTLFDSRFMTPIKTKGEQIRQYRPVIGQTQEGAVYGPSQIRAERTLITGSRFPTPGYRFESRSVDLTQLYEPLINPYTDRPVLDPERADAPQDVGWRIDARQNVFYLGPLPVFYWPRLLTDSDDLDPPLRQIQYRYNNYFGHQVLTDWSLFKILGIKRPYFIDNWNLDVDNLSNRGLALGSEFGWSGKDLIKNITDPYNRRSDGPSNDREYFGYFNIWGLKDHGNDVLGTGRAVVTNGPSWSQRRFFRDNVPPFQDFRGRFLTRHMQSLVSSDAPFDEDLRLQLEAAYVSDRHFLEQYYKRLFDSGLDQATLAYLIRQRQNTALTLHAEVNLQNFYTDTQWFPKLDYYRLGDSFLGDWFTYWQNSGIDYGNTHTAVEVANPGSSHFCRSIRSPRRPARFVPAEPGRAMSSTCRWISAS